MFEVLYHARARKFLDRIDPKRQHQIHRAIERLRENPHDTPHLAPLQGDLKGFHRLRVGEYRIVVKIDVVDRTIVVLAVGPRGDIYK